jgi:hypothetical protein
VCTHIRAILTIIPSDVYRPSRCQLGAAGRAREAPGTWAHGDLHIGRITSDGAALITFAKAPGEVPVHPPETAGERLVEYLLRQNEAKAD